MLRTGIVPKGGRICFVVVIDLPPELLAPLDGCCFGFSPLQPAMTDEMLADRRDFVLLEWDMVHVGYPHDTTPKPHKDLWTLLATATMHPDRGFQNDETRFVLFDEPVNHSNGLGETGAVMRSRLA